MSNLNTEMTTTRAYEMGQESYRSGDAPTADAVEREFKHAFLEGWNDAEYSGRIHDTRY